jgi:2-phosphoglycerate kinase
MVENWLRNNGRQPAKELVKYDRGSQMVRLFVEEHRTELQERTMEASGDRPGGRTYLGHFQTIRKQMMDEMSDDEREAFEERVQELSRQPHSRTAQLK